MLPFLQNKQATQSSTSETIRRESDSGESEGSPFEMAMSDLRLAASIVEFDPQLAKSLIKSATELLQKGNK